MCSNKGSHTFVTAFLFDHQQILHKTKELVQNTLSF